MTSRRPPTDPRSLAPLTEPVKSLLSWFSREARDLPWRHTRDPYAIWVSEIMLQQTQVKTVLPYWKKWMKTFPTLQALAHATPEKVLKAWEGLGYYRRARHLHEAARLIHREMKGAFPKDFMEIMALPGIGRYTAGAISSIAFNHPDPVLDGNVIRVLTRLNGITQPAKENATVTTLWNLADQLVHVADQLQRTSWSPSSSPGLSPHFCSHLNQSLMELGALICTPRQPACPRCPLQSRCVAHQRDQTGQIPNLAPREASTPRRVVAFLVHKDGLYLVRQRPSNGLNGDLWEFPNLEIQADFHLEATPAKVAASSPLHQLARQELGFFLSQLAYAMTVRHSITRYRIALTAFHGHWIKGRLPRNSTMVHRWLDPVALKKLPFSSAHRRLITSLE